jgi:hypothetical protein
MPGGQTYYSLLELRTTDIMQNKHAIPLTSFILILLSPNIVLIPLLPWTSKHPDVTLRLTPRPNP